MTGFEGAQLQLCRQAPFSATALAAGAAVALIQECRPAGARVLSQEQRHHWSRAPSRSNVCTHNHVPLPLIFAVMRLSLSFSREQH